MAKRTDFSFLLYSLCILALSSGCNTLIYTPRGYTEPVQVQLLADRSVTKIHYRVNNDRQTAFYVKAKDRPGRLWLLLGGINSLALDWHQWFAGAADDDTAFLYVDYPGYGLNEGSPKAENMFQAAEEAFRALEKFLPLPESGKLEVNVLGHSLGSGVAIEFAERIQVRKLLLIAPFTNLKELIRYRYGSFIGALINMINPERYPNVSTLGSIAEQQNPPQVILIHGADDQVIPAAMSRRLAQMFPEIISYYELPLTGHRNIFADKLDLILSHMEDTER